MLKDLRIPLAGEDGRHGTTAARTSCGHSSSLPRFSCLIQITRWFTPVTSCLTSGQLELIIHNVMLA
eukprot:2262142-Amphidinium_carterae.1